MLITWPYIIDGVVFEVVKEFVYHGTLMTYNNDISSDAKRRTTAPRVSAIYRLRKNVCEFPISQSQEIRDI